MANNEPFYSIIKTPQVHGPKHMRYTDEIEEAHELFEKLLSDQPAGTVRLYYTCGRDILELLREESREE